MTFNSINFFFTLSMISYDFNTDWHVLSKVIDKDPVTVKHFGQTIVSFKTVMVHRFSGGFLVPEELHNVATGIRGY